MALGTLLRPELRVLAYHMDGDDPLCRRLLRRPEAFLARAIGDALLAFDPLASQGLLHALASATSAAKAIETGLHQSLGAYQQEMQAVTQRYLRHLKASYQGPRRFGRATFWQRRQ
ncbi:hypothetical protein [Halomonas kalidii]|uniref:Uncharacterized protein n=1 Tax=Halomonas kalidii TaxID=3043293 RepID=A0ABT6VQT8_9GAMM|nr:hypothetical protein [Halomonas kalidii]MDI5936352.1 hypothetical protein [Halomonas kalidii]